MAFLKYSFDSAVKFGGWALSAILLLYTVYRNHVSDKRVQRAELAKESAVNRLHEIESRGKAPYFVPSGTVRSVPWRDVELASLRNIQVVLRNLGS